MLPFLNSEDLLTYLFIFSLIANVVIEDATERIIIEKKFCDKKLGTLLFRGENVELVAEIVCNFPPDSTTISPSQLGSDFLG
jgi:hypothetical protein